MSVTDCIPDAKTHAALYAIVRYTGTTSIWVRPTTGGSVHKALLSARFNATEVQQWASQNALALVMPIAAADDPDVFGVVIDFVRTDGAPRKARVLEVDEICFGNGSARIYWDVDALRIAAENIDSQARFIHRISGGSIKIG